MDANPMDAAPEHELIAFGCLALPRASLDAVDLRQIARSAAKRAGLAGRWTAKEWGRCFASAVERSLLRETGGRLSLAPRLETQVLLALAKRPGALEGVRRALLAQLGEGHALAPVVDARAALYGGEREALDAALVDLAGTDGPDALDDVEFEQVVARFGPIDPGALSALGWAVAEPLGPFVLEQALARGQPLDEGALALFKQATGIIRAQAAMIQIFGTGDDGGLLDGLENEPFAHELRVLGALAHGEIDRARELAREAWARLPKRRKKPHFDGALAHLLAFLLATGDAEDVSIARVHLASIRDKRKTRISGAERLALAYIEGAPLPRSHELHPEWVSVVAHVALAHARGEPPPEVPTSLEELCREQGHAWLADQLAALRAWRSDPLHPPEGLVFARIVPVKARWEKELDALESLLGPLPGEEDAEAEPEGAERLAWWVEIRDDRHGARLYAEPRLQRRNARGWTRGAAVALRRIYRAAKDVPWLRPEDRPVVACLVAHGGWAYGHQDLELNRDVALALVGHPRVYWAADPTHPVAVVKKDPSVRVSERDGGAIEMRFHPVSVTGRSPVVERVGTHAIEVYPLDDKLSEIARRVQAQLSLPPDARPRLEKLLARLAPVVTVESDVAPEATGGREVTADPRPVLRLGRADEGLKLEVKVAPLGLEGPMLEPGRGGRTVAAQVAGTRLRCERDLELEASMAAMLEAECPSLSGGTGTAVRTFELPEALALLEELRALGDDVIHLWTDGDPLEVVATRALSHLRISAEASGQDWLALDGSLELDDEAVLDLQSLLARAPRRHGRFVKLDDARFVALSAELAGRLDLLSAARAEADEVKISPLAAGLLAGWEDEIGAFDVAEKVREQIARAKEAASLKPRVPKTLDAELRDYQREGYRWLRRLAHWGAGACLADDMGLGKTVQTLALLVARASEGPALVVAPTSVCGNWADEAARFAPTLRIHEISGAPGDLDALGPYDLAVVSHTLLALHAEAFAARSFATVVLDEAQAIKNPDTQRARAAFGLQADFRVATTGTPVENRLLELWSLMRFLNPGLLGPRAAFERRFAKPIQADPTGSAMRQLQQLVRPFILRRTKREVLTELPPRTEIVHEVVPTADEAAFSEALRREALERLGDAGPGAAIEILAALTRLRQAACAPSLLRPDLDLPSSKLDAFETLAEELVSGGHRALVFSQFVSFLELARSRAEGLGLSVKYLDGSTPAAKRRADVAAFQEGEGDLFFISLKAGGTGLNLTGADYVVHLDPWWNPAVEDQASDRAHRMGQTRPVTIYRLVTQGSIEEKVLALHGEKRELAERLLEGTDAAAAPDAEALLELLR